MASQLRSDAPNPGTTNKDCDEAICSEKEHGQKYRQEQVNGFAFEASGQTDT